MRRELQQRERLESLTYELTLTNRKLAESNSELEQFAYVASHDLKEPLRMVTSFADLIRRRYSDKLGADGVEFIGFLVDATKRMQALLDALLDYSRIGTRGVRFVRTDCNALLEDVRRSLVVRFEEVGGNLTHDPLPEIVADPVQIGQLFQNLIENGLKFHGPEPPHLHVSAVRSDNEWVFTVSDNGIGINPVHYDRIFLIFKRLHAREEYPGTGIGLATCKKIVQRHGGRIWVESEVNKGSRFFFTIPCQLSEPSA
jgi:light-regulated signal transduction histidine kinase (bacteriophytochrome)